jgi:hypothetical protein
LGSFNNSCFGIFELIKNVWCNIFGNVVEVPLESFGKVLSDGEAAL